MTTLTDVAKQLDTNPHALQMVEILAKRPDLLAKLESGDEAVIKEVSDLAYEHFLLLSISITEGLTEGHREFRQRMSDRVYNKFQTA